MSFIGVFILLPQLADGLHQVNGDDKEIHHCHRPGIAQNCVDQANKTTAHIDDPQLQHGSHQHRKDHQHSADIAENFKIDIHTILQNKIKIRRNEQVALSRLFYYTKFFSITQHLFNKH